MLEVRYGVADRSHENEFFRTFAQSLKSYFDDQGIDALLLGFPTCRVRDDLQIDALLVTDKTLTVIDFKNYSGSITLPDEQDFKRGTWKTATGVTVKGGSSPNPFYQMGLQRKRLSDILATTARNLTSFDPHHITSLVCFTDKVTIAGGIPGKFRLSFFLADSETFVQKIFDIVNVGRKSLGLLDKKFADHLNSKLFETTPYDCFLKPLTIEPSAEKDESKQDSPRQLQSTNTDKIQAFIEGDDDVLIITGMVGSGKRLLAPSIRDIAHKTRFSSVRVFALSNRVKNNLHNSMDEVESLYASLFDFSAREFDEKGGREIIPLGKMRVEEPFSDIDDDCELLRSVFVVYESQMVTDSLRMDGTVQFGSGKLLSDLMSYLGIDGKTKQNKLVFIGDRYQLSFGSWRESSLNPAAYPAAVKTSWFELPDPSEVSGIENVCRSIAHCIRAERFANLVVTPNNMTSLSPKEDEGRLIQDAVTRKDHHKILTYTNKQASQINNHVKTRILNSGSKLAQGDLIVFANQILAYPSDKNFVSIPAFESMEPRRIENGTFGVVEAVDPQKITHTPKDQGEPVSINLAHAHIRLNTKEKELVEIWAIEEFLYAEKAELSPREEQLIQIHLRELFQEYERSHPFAKGDPHFDAMLASGDYAHNESGAYRDKNDLRMLTKYEKAHRAENRKHLARDPASEYFKWDNAARIRFGWCLTVHKAMSYQWDEVTFSTNYEGGRNNAEFFRFLYTGISRAQNMVHLVRWSPVSPFANTEYQDSSSSLHSAKRVLLKTKSANVYEDIQRMLENLEIEGLTITDAKSRPYLEIYGLARGAEKVTLGFDYNKNGEVRPPRRLNGSEAFFAEILERLEGLTQESSASQNAVLYEYLTQSVLDGISIVVEKAHQYQDRLIFRNDDTEFRASLYYDGKGLVSRFEFVSGNPSLFKACREMIEQHYDPSYNYRQPT